MAYTSLKDHLLRMTQDSHAWEEAKLYEALQGSSKIIQQQHRVNCQRLAQAQVRLLDWQPTIPQA